MRTGSPRAHRRRSRRRPLRTDDPGHSRAANLPRLSEVANNPKPSPEIEQLVLFGRLDEAVALYAKQAEVDEETARAVIDALAAA